MVASLGCRAATRIRSCLVFLTAETRQLLSVSAAVEVILILQLTYLSAKVALLGVLLLIVMVSTISRKCQRAALHLTEKS